MKIMVVGGGGREHAIIKKIRQNRTVTKVFALPGNGGIAADAECVAIGAKDIKGITDFAVQNGIDFAVVAPDDPLAMGAVDALNAVGVPCFGPTASAAAIESSKIFAKELMKKYRIPTAAYEIFSDMDAALNYLKTAPLPTVIKADGLALGKGVIIAQTRREAEEAVISMMKERAFGDAGSRIVIEEFLTGPEVSVLSFTDGRSIVPMVSSMDHKRALDGDLGLNTGGMGAIAPNPYYTDEISNICMDSIFVPTVRAMRAEGREFRGCLYFGLMLTADGPKVIEYNCRFGDPEAQVVLPLLESDLLDIMIAVSQGKLAEADVRFSDKAACCVIMASQGYPKSYQSGCELGLPQLTSDCEIYVAGAKKENSRLVSAGGRVLGVTAVAATLDGAIARAYENVKKVKFSNGFYRSDIGRRALMAPKTEA